MPFTSPGALRSAGRKAANSLRSNHPNGGSTHSGGGTSSRALHSVRNPLSNAHYPDAAHIITNSLDAIRPRNPAHILFSSTKGVVAKLFNKIAAPGFRVPRLASTAGRSLQQARPITIQAGLSAPTRHAIRNNNFRSLGSGTFLPRAPQIPLRGHVASQVGLGTARSFSTARPIFQNIVDNVPIAVRALYEADLDNLKRGNAKRMRTRKVPVKKTKKTTVGGSKLKAKSTTFIPTAKVDEEQVIDSAELEHYFPAPILPFVTAELLIPLAPPVSSASRSPLSALEGLGDEGSLGIGRFLPLSLIGQMHQSHSNHALKVSTLFARLDQANVWARGGVVCFAISGPGPGIIRERRPGSDGGIKLASGNIDLAELEGTCTMLKIEFQGWTAADVRAVIGESGQGWCSLEEVWHNDEDNISLFAEALSDVSTPAFFSPSPSRPSEINFDMGMPVIDPAQSFILPTLDFSLSLPPHANERRAFAGRENQHSERPNPTLDDPWAEFETSSIGSGSSDSDDGYMSFASLSPPLSRSSSFASFEALPAAQPSPSRSEPSWSRVEFNSSFLNGMNECVEGEPWEALF